MRPVSEYVTWDGAAYRIDGSRVTLDSVLYPFWDGASPEAIQQDYPTLSLESVYGAIAFYLGNKDRVDSYMRDGEVISERVAVESDERNADLISRLKLVSHGDPVSR
jgi:uncharacterized protein (DUF433 family)